MAAIISSSLVNNLFPSLPHHLYLLPLQSSPPALCFPFREPVSKKKGSVSSTAMEVMIPSPPMEFDFSSARSSPYVLTAPSTPRRFGKYYFSTPTSPSHMANFYQDFDEFSNIEEGFDASSSSNIAFGWEEKPGKPKSPKGSEDEEEDFAFSVCEDSEGASVSAEELFDHGKIRPLKPPPRLQLPNKSKGRSTEAAMEKALKRKPEKDRGRDRAPGNGPGPRAAQSVSPYRVSSYPWEEEKEKQQLPKLNNNNNNNSNNSSISSSKGSGSGSKKWRLKDLFLFRSASEGRATDKDPFRKYAAVFRRQEEIRNSSFRSATESSSPGSISRRRSGPVSAHELHYTVNKAVSEDLKKRTFLPYKQGILGRLAFNPAVSALANRFGSLYR